MADFEKSKTDTEESKSARPRRKSRREAPVLGSLASEGLIFTREKEPTPRAKRIAETLRKGTRQETATDTQADRKPSVTEPSKAATAAVAETAAATKPDSEQGEESSTESTRSTAELETDHETDEKLSQLTPEETRHAMDEYVQVRGMEVAAEQVAAEPESAEADALQADATMLENLRDKLQANPEADPDHLADEAYQEALAALPSEPEPEASPPADNESSSEAPAVSDTAAETPPETGTPADRTPEPMPFPLRSAVGGAAAPEYVPTPPEQRPGPMRSVISIEEAAHYERRAETRGLLVGGLVGYFIGRRRGRIKTEKRLLPVQEKLEKQVKTLHETVAGKEAALREEAARRHELRRQYEQQREREQRDRQFVQKKQEIKQQLNAKPEVVSVKPLEPESLPNAFENLPGGPMVEVTAAATAAKATEQAPASKPELVPPIRPQAELEPAKVEPKLGPASAERIKQLSTAELVSESEQVVIGGERLRDIYESKRITEPGLRQVMMEYARGGNVEKVLQQEIHNKELTYERDPKLRKGLAGKLTNAGGKAGEVVGKVASAAGPKLAATGERAKTVGKKVVGKSVETAKKLDNPSKPVQQVVVRTWIVTTVILAIIAFILLLR